MPIFFSQLIVRLRVLRSWATPIAVTAVVFVTAWPLLVLTEGPDSSIVEPSNYWWWFVVTAATVGYGDFYPQSAGGHAVGAYVIVGGIVTLTTLFTKLAAVLEQAKGNRMQGATTVEAAEHVVLLGYTPGRTEGIVGEVLAEGRRVVLCVWDDVATHPMPQHDVDFVRGDLTDPTVLKRAGVDRAHSVLIDVRDDNEALAVAVTADHILTDANLVVTLRDMARSPLFGHVNKVIRCVQWHTPHMITEELESPGISEVYAELMTHGGASTYLAALPHSLGPILVGDCQTSLGRQHGASILAVRTHGRLLVNPAWHTELPAGSALYYVAPRRLTPDEITLSLSTGARD
jgi:Trk K+ transport system NAD-binding subunit